MGLDVVTDLDKSIEARILGLLKTLGHSVIGEESTDGNGSFDLPSAPFWVVDPIDGTANYVNGMPFFGTAVGLCNPGSMKSEWVAGAVSLPVSKELFLLMVILVPIWTGKTVIRVYFGKFEKSHFCRILGAPGDPSFRELPSTSYLVKSMI